MLDVLASSYGATLRVRPPAKVSRRRATVSGMSGATGAGTAGALWGIESVVMWRSFLTRGIHRS